MLTFKQVNESRYDIIISGKPAGELEVIEDGFFVFWPKNYCNGYYPEWFMVAVADKLKDLNKDLDKQIKEYFKNDK